MLASCVLFGGDSLTKSERFGYVGFILTLTVINPTMLNRVVVLDLMASEAVRTGEHTLLDVAVVIGITAFIGTAAFAMLIDRDSGKE